MNLKKFATFILGRNYARGHCSTHNIVTCAWRECVNLRIYHDDVITPIWRRLWNLKQINIFRKIKQTERLQGFCPCCLPPSGMTCLHMFGAQFHGSGLPRNFALATHIDSYALQGSISAAFCGKQCH